MATAVLSGTVGTASAALQGSWILPAVDLSVSGKNAFEPQIDAAPDGTATAVWRRWDGSDDIIQAATCPPGGSFGAPVDLSATGESADTPQMAVAPDGTATVVWHRSDGSNNIIQAATRPSGGSFGTPIDLSISGQDANVPQITAAPDGTATAVWYRSNGSNDIIQAATRPPGGSFAAPANLSVIGGNAGAPQITTAPDGTATAVWYRNNGSNDIIQAATRPPGGSFAAPVNLSVSGQHAQSPRITTASDGTATVVWYRSDGSNYIVQAATRPPGGSFAAPVDLSVSGEDASAPQISTASDGATTVVWQRSNGSNYIIQAATRTPGGSFGTPVNLSATDQNASAPQITAAPDGTATAVWYRNNGSYDVIQTATRPPGGSFAAPVNLSVTGGNAGGPEITTAPDGTATAVWHRYDGSNDIIESISTAQPSPLLSVSKTGSGSGTVTSTPSGIDCGVDCSGNYPSYTRVTLIATPDPGSTFGEWGGACDGAVGNTCDLTMLEDQEATATFEASSPPAGEPKLKVTKIKPGKPKVKRGKTVKLKVTVRNAGDAAAKNAKLCVTLSKSVKKALKPQGKTCQKLGSLGAGKAKTKPFKLKAKKKAKKGKKYQVKFKLTANGAKAVTKAVKVKVK